MKYPNKAILYNESVISKFSSILTLLSRGSMSATELYLAVKTQIEDVADFVDALDCLYALGKIELNSQTRRLSYVV